MSRTTKLIGLLISCLLVFGCASLGQEDGEDAQIAYQQLVEREFARMVAEEIAIYATRNNEEMVRETILPFLKRMENTPDGKLLPLVEIAANWTLEHVGDLDPSDKARLSSKLKSLAKILGITRLEEEITLPENIDIELIKAIRSGLLSGIHIALL